MKIAVYGATGYTAGLVIEELVRRGAEHVPVGRDLSGLRPAFRETAADLRTASLDDPARLAAAFHGCDAVINCVAPFVLHGEPVVRAALAAGVHYVYVTGEQYFIKRVFDVFGEDARRAGVTVMPAATDDGFCGDLLASAVAEQALGGADPAGRTGVIEELTMAHRLVSGGPSRGTMRSALANRDMFASGGLGYADGRWRTGGPARRTHVAFPGDEKPSPVVKFGAPEVIMIPRHVPVRHVEGVTDAALIAALASVTPELVENTPPGPDEERRRAARFTLLAEAVTGDGRRTRGVLEGSDMYGTTAVTAVEAVHRILADTPAAGVRTPGECFPAAAVLDSLAPHGVRWAVE